MIYLDPFRSIILTLYYLPLKISSFCTQITQHPFCLKSSLFLASLFIFFPFQAVTKQEKENHLFSIQLRGEGRLSKNQISKNQSGLYPDVPYTELEFHYSKNENLDLVINFEVESQNRTWSISVDEFSFSYDFQDIPFNIKIGWSPIPLGYLDVNTNVFSKDLSLYDSISYNREDIGITARVWLLQSALSLQIDRLGGWSYREWDNSYNQPESAPMIVSLKSQGSFWDFFVSWFEEELAFFDPVQAIGAGISLNTSYKKLAVSIQSELWQITQERQTTFAYYVFPSIAIDKIKVGMVFESVNHFSPSVKKAQATSSIYERIFQVSYQIHPDITIIGERFISTQKKGPLLNDLWSARVKVNFGWSSAH